MTIAGTGFSHVKSVTFGRAKGRSLKIESAKKLVVTSPPGAAGIDNVRVTTSGGTSKIVKADRFTFVAPPAVKAVSPASGSTAGGQSVTVTGTGFSGIRTVTFGGTTSGKIKVVSTTKLTVTSPKHAAGRVAVRVTGTYGTSPSTSHDDYMFVTPSAWTPASMPYTDSSGAHSGSSIAGVACQAATSCIAVGQALGDPKSATATANPLVETLTGTTWTGKVLPLTTTDTTGYLSAVSCPSSTECVAVGRGYSSSTRADLLVETFTGGTWSGSHLPTPTGGATLSSIWCESSASCVAVGSGTNGTNDTPLVETLVDGTWTATTLEVTDGSTIGDLAGVSCVSATACVAVGSSGTAPLVETYDGTTWAASSPPLPDGAVSGSLLAVSCPAADSCTAVGTDDASSTTALIEQQSAGGWTPTKPDLPTGHSDGQLGSVSCATATTCTAVGYDIVSTSGTQTDYPLVETLGATSWTPENPPVTQNTAGFLVGLSCTGATSCTAVGNHSVGGGLSFSDTRK